MKTLIPPWKSRRRLREGKRKLNNHTDFMNLKLRLTILSFLQFFVWGAWLTTLGTYGFSYKQWSGAEFGAVFSTLGIRSEEHTSELQSRENLVCRLLLE